MFLNKLTPLINERLSDLKINDVSQTTRSGVIECRT